MDKSVPTKVKTLLRQLYYWTRTKNWNTASQADYRAGVVKMGAFITFIKDKRDIITPENKLKIESKLREYMERLNYYAEKNNDSTFTQILDLPETLNTKSPNIIRAIWDVADAKVDPTKPDINQAPDEEKTMSPGEAKAFYIDLVRTVKDNPQLQPLLDKYMRLSASDSFTSQEIRDTLTKKIRNFMKDYGPTQTFLVKANDALEKIADQNAIAIKEATIESQRINNPFDYLRNQIQNMKSAKEQLDPEVDLTNLTDIERKQIQDDLEARKSALEAEKLNAKLEATKLDELQKIKARLELAGVKDVDQTALQILKGELNLDEILQTSSLELEQKAEDEAPPPPMISPPKTDLQDVTREASQPITGLGVVMRQNDLKNEEEIIKSDANKVLASPAVLQTQQISKITESPFVNGPMPKIMKQSIVKDVNYLRNYDQPLRIKLAKVLTIQEQSQGAQLQPLDAVSNNFLFNYPAKVVYARRRAAAK